jgi:HAD superfamily hydrolase (TIGR01509 family)
VQTTTVTVIMDMDGVMIDSEPMQLAAYNIVLAPHGIALSEADFINWCVGRKSRENFAFLRERFSLPESVDELLAAKDTSYSAILRDNMHPMPGLLALLERLTAARYLLAVASSSRRADIEAVLGGLSVQTYFREAVSGEEVARGKPEPDIFLEAARRLGVSPGTCVVLEDTQTGVEAATRAGMRCVAVPNRFTAQQDFSRANACVPNLDGVTLQLLDRVAQRS